MQHVAPRVQRATAKDALLLARLPLPGRGAHRHGRASPTSSGSTASRSTAGSARAIACSSKSCGRWPRATLAAEGARVTATGAEHIVQVITRFIDDCLTNAGMKRLLGEEGERTMRLLTRRDKGFQPRLIDAVQRLLDEETQGRAPGPARRPARGRVRRRAPHRVLRLPRHHHRRGARRPGRGAGPADAAALIVAAPTTRGRKFGPRHDEHGRRDPYRGAMALGVEVPAAGYERNAVTADQGDAEGEGCGSTRSASASAA